MNLPASDHQLPRLSALLGRKVAESITEAQERIHDVGVSVYLAPWELSRSRGDRLYVYVNGRNIRDRLLTRAIIEGYGQRLMKGHYPQAAIFLEMDPSKVDINVHPTKQEVRFHNSRDVFQAVVSTIEKALACSFQPLYGQKPEQVPAFVSDISEPFRESSQPVPARGTPARAVEPAQSIISELPQIIGQLGNTYILCQVKDGLLMVDQHAAHERIMYENLKKGFDNSRIEAQVLLVPHKMELSAREKRVVQEKGDRLSRFGIELEHFGGHTFLLRSVPALLENVEWDSFLSEFLAELEENEPGEDALFDRALTVMACHGAIRAGYRMTDEEITHLFRQLEEMDLPTNCPHGRPIFKHFTYYEIEKMFKRVI
jgi:DNA mismatch repair protein MutL